MKMDSEVRELRPPQCSANVPVTLIIYTNPPFQIRMAFAAQWGKLRRVCVSAMASGFQTSGSDQVRPSSLRSSAHVRLCLGSSAERVEA